MKAGGEGFPPKEDLELIREKINHVLKDTDFPEDLKAGDII